MLRHPLRAAAGLVAVAATLPLLACGPRDTAMTDTMTTMAGPDTTAEAVWAHLQQENYTGSWAMWPGKTALYAGGEPHGMLLTTYVNTPARDAITGGSTSLPPGSIVVKENYMPDSTLAAVTVMYKVAGYDTANNDWFWLKRLANGEVEASGRVAMCADCHRTSADFIRTQTLGAASTGG